MLGLSSSPIPKIWAKKGENWAKENGSDLLKCKLSPFALTMNIEKEDWAALEYKITGNLIVHISPLDLKQKKNPKILAALFKSLKEKSDWFAKLNPNSALLGWDENPQKLLKEIGQEIGFTEFSFTVISLTDQCGFGWDGESGVMLKIGEELPDPDEIAAYEEEEAFPQLSETSIENQLT